MVVSVHRMKEEKVYTCGSALFAIESEYVDTIVVRIGLGCRSPMETAYYCGKVSHFAEVCFHCGSADDISTDDKIQGLKRQFSVVRLICSACLAEGKEPSVRGGGECGW